MTTKLTEPTPHSLFRMNPMVVMGGNSRNVVLAAELIKSMSTAADKYVVNGINSRIFTAHLYGS